MKQFDLEEYKKHYDRKIVTGRGNNVRIVCTDCKGDYPVVALIEGTREEVPNSYTSKGELYTGCIASDVLYFITKKVTKYCIYNIENNYMYSNIYDTEEGAEYAISVFYPNVSCKVISFETEVYDTI